ncbi:MAG: hypothetical protein A2W91_03150 [Bacteroidetes bacterium GWF2_38_335]|nr:MAG: hypothetical protein A2W91_03150 [Bacteroidetes bacterium GWF2_38_335]OFY77513.1 MAG: hypothetical protein A2281_01610 [Bacteroidetes bacterium RIFOXYA12_FULL_38_20]HBS87191.1 hypothetical protein [Bacteroidales bacterium]
MIKKGIKRCLFYFIFDKKLIFLLLQNMKTFAFFSLLVCMIVLISCKKNDDKFIISGTLINNYEDSYVSGATVKLYGQKIESGTWNSNFTVITTGVTDASGHFSFTFDVESYSAFRLEFSKDRYIKKLEEVNAANVEKGEDYNREYSFFSEAWLKLSISNTWPSAEEDYITYRIVNDASGFSDCCSSDFTTITGSEIFDTITCKTFGGHTVLIEWNVKSGPDMIHYSQNVLCPSFDTTTFSITY